MYFFIFRDNMRDNFQSFRDAFNKYDKRVKGYLTSLDIQRLLVDNHYVLDDDQLYDLLQK